LSRSEFERRYAAMPRNVKAELIEGVVVVASPVSVNHANSHLDIATWLGTYRSATPGTDAADNSTIRIDLRNEPQPDAALYVEPECGGRIRFTEDRWIEGAPELVAEIAASSASVDRGPKMVAYARNAVREYVVWRVYDDAIDWFVLRDGSYFPIQASDDGILRSATFPSLWLDAAAMARRNLARVLAVLRLGLQSAEHARFVTELESRRTA